MAEATETEAPADTVTVVVDGNEIQARPGEMLIAAAERAGVYIPRFCYHPRLRPVGMCRMCLVEVKGQRGFTLTPACFVPVADGQEVVTDSAKVKKAQDGVLEFLLINHPLDCPVCDRGGECPLQDQTFAFGPGETRFVEEKRHWEKPIPLSDLVYLDRERCIQCDRCTRFADEVAGDALIEFVGRADHIEINTFPDQPFSSYFSGNTVQICPVGALLARPYRFRARPWDLEQVESTCTACAVGCRIAVQSTEDRLTRYLGLDSDPVNHGWLCDKGRFSYEAVNSPERLAGPLVRSGSELVDASWADALDAAAEGLAAARGGAGIGVIGGARLANEDAYAWARLAKSVLGTDSVDAQLGDGLPAELVLGLPRATIDEACTAPVVVLLAPDLKEELPVLYLRLRAAAVGSGLRLIEITPQPTGLTRYAHVTLGYRPGEAAAVVRALVGAGPAAEVGGIPAAMIETARQALRTGGDRPAVVLGRPSLAESAASIVDAAAALTEALPGARFLSALRRGNVHGALDMGLAPGILPGRVSLDSGREWFTDGWGAVPATSGLDTHGIMTAAAAGKLGALVLLGADPLADFPDRDLARRAVEGAGLVVAVDSFLTESVKRADVVLAAAMFAERRGTTTNIEGRITRLGQKITPAATAWPDWMVASELASRLGAGLGFECLEDIWDEVERLAPSHAGITRAVLGSPPWRDGVVVPLREPLDESLPLASTDTGAGATAPAPAAVDPMGTPGIDAVETQGVPLMAMSPDDGPGVGAGATGSVRPPLLRFEGVEEKAASPALDAYSLRLVSGRKLYDRGVAVQRSPALAPLQAAPRLRVNPHDLDRLGVPTGGQVRLRAPRCTAIVEVVGDPGLPRGSAALPFNLADLAAADIIDAGRPVNDVAIETP